MKQSKLLVTAIVVFTTFALSACAPRPNGSGGPQGSRLSPSELFSNADVNGDNMLSMEEFENSLPEHK